MADEGTGRALGAGAEAFQGALFSTLNYRIAQAQHQLQVGMQKERLAMNKERQAFDLEKIQQDIRTGAIEQQAEREDLRAKVRKGELAREADKLIGIVKQFPVSEGAKVEKKGAPRARQPFAAFQQGDFDDEKLLEAYNLAGRKAPLSLLTRISEMNLTPHEIEIRRLEKEELKVGIAKTKAETVAKGIPKAAGTLTERDRAKLLKGDISEAEKRMIERSLFGDKLMVDGISTIEISRSLDDFYPVGLGGIRKGFPPELRDDPVATYRHIAKLLKQTQIPSVIDETDEQIDTGTGGSRYFN